MRFARLVAGVVVCACLLATLPGGAEAAPDPGGNERVNLRLPSDQAFVGLNENLGMTMSAPETAGAVREVGGRVLRSVVSWNFVEPRQGVWDERVWARLSQQNEQLKKRGVQMLAIIGFAPSWARERGFAGGVLPPTACSVAVACGYPPRPEMDDAWRRFVREAARRLPGAMFQTWNEPNLETYWRSGPDPERWAELHVAAWQEIRRVRPKAKVIACGCVASGYGQPGTIGIREFLVRAFRHGTSIRGRYDAIGFNVWPQGGDGHGRRFGSNTWFAQSFADVRRAARVGGDRRPRLVVTELGLWTNAGPVPLSEDERARSMVRLVRRIATMRDVDGVILHRLLARSEDAPIERSMSLLRVPGGQPTPAWCWLSNMAGNYAARGCPRVARPRSAILRGPARVTRSRSARIAFRARPASARLECSIQGRAFRRCLSPLRLRGLKRGRHVVRIRAWSESGAQQARPARHVWRVRG